jgi:hypothetical protein
MAVFWLFRLSPAESNAKCDFFISSLLLAGWRLSCQAVIFVILTATREASARADQLKVVNEREFPYSFIGC